MATVQVKTPGVYHRIKVLAALLLTAAALLAPSMAGAQQPDNPPRPPRARDLLRSAQDSYRGGDYEGAAQFYKQAEQNKVQLDEAEKASLAAQVAANNTALQSSREGAVRLRQASDLLKQGKAQEAGALVKTENANAYLKPADRQLLAQLNEQLKAKGIVALAGGPASKPLELIEQPKEDYRSLVAQVRIALQCNELDSAEALCKQAEKARGLIPGWVQPWNDNDGKVLHDVQAARMKQAAAATAHREQAAKTEKKEEPSLLASGFNKVKSMFGAGEKAQGPVLPEQDIHIHSPAGGKVVSGSAAPANDHAPKPLAPQISEETANARQMRDLAVEALNRNDLAQAKRYAETAKAKLDPNAWWEAPSPDQVLMEIARRQGGPVKTASNTAEPQAKPVTLPPPPGTAPVPADAASARIMLQEARGHFAKGRLEEADHLCAQVAAGKVKWGLFEDNPDKLRGDIKSARQMLDKTESVKVLAEARKLMAAGNYQEARVKAWKAKQLHGPYSIMEVGDRPDRLLSEIDTAEAKQKRTGDNPANVAKNSQKSGPNGTKPSDSEPQPTPVAAMNAKQRAQGLLAEARVLQKQNRLVEANAKALEARAAAAEAYKAGLRFSGSEESPDLYLTALANQGKTKIIALLEDTEKLTAGPAADLVKLKKAADNLNEARVLAVTFDLAVEPIEMKLRWVGNRLPGGVQLAPLPQVASGLPAPPMVPAGLPAVQAVASGFPAPPAIGTDPAAGNKGLELLEQAKREIRSGRNAEARKFAEEAYQARYGVQTQAAQVLRAIELEEFEQKRLDCDRAFNAAYDAFLRKEYKQAQSIVANLDEMMLSPEKQRRLREIALSKEMQPVGTAVVQQLKAQTIDAPLPGNAKVTDQVPGSPGALKQEGDTAAMERYKALARINFDKMTKEGLVAQQDALKRAQANDLDGAMDVLRAYNACLSDAGLDSDQIATLRRPIDRYLDQYGKRKAQAAFVRDQNGLLENGKEREQAREKSRQTRDSEVVKLVEQHNQLMRDGKFDQALIVAEHVLEVDPNNLAGQAGRYQARVQSQLRRNDETREAKAKQWLDALDDDPGPLVNMKTPMNFDPKRLETASNRANYTKGISSQLHDQVEQHIERTLTTRKVALSLNNTPLYEAVEALKAYCGDINIVFDHQALQELGIRKDQPLSQSFSNISLKSALNILLKDAKLTHIIKNQAITITTEEWAKGSYKTTVHPVTDLVVPIENHPSPVIQYERAKMNGLINKELNPGGYVAPTPYVGPLGLPPGNPASSPSNNPANTLGGRPPKPEGQTVEDVLIRLITHTIAPDTWSDVGGKGTIQYFPTGMALVVNQTQDIQEQIVDLLAALRRLQDLEVAIEMRLVSVSEAFFERIGVDFDVNILHGSTRYESELINGVFRPPTPPLSNQFRPSSFWSGLTPAGTFTPDLGVPIKQSSFDFSLPPFGGYPGTLGADGGLSLGLAFLSDIQVFMFLDAAQGDRRTNVMQAPKITVFNGQTANISVTDQVYFLTSINAVNTGGQTAFLPVQSPQFYGVNMSVTPVVSADRRFVRLNLSPQLQNLISATVPLIPVQQVVPQNFYDGQSPPQPQVFQLFFQQPSSSFITLDTTVVVPDGGTVLMGGLKTLVEARNEFGPPVLSKIPYLSRLFKNVGYGREAQSLMIMVTARIIINEEEELEFLNPSLRIPR